MFEAFLLVLTLDGPVPVKDTRGPYATKPACEERIEQMKADLPNLMQVKGYLAEGCMQSGHSA